MIGDPHRHRIDNAPRQSLRPFDGDHAVRGQILIEADLIELGPIETIEIDVNQRQTPAALFVDERERRTGDVIGIEAETLSQPSHKCRLARSEIA